MSSALTLPWEWFGALWEGAGTQDHAPLPELMAAGVHFGRTRPGESSTDASSIKAGVGR